jgi:hypothetical protein
VTDEKANCGYPKRTASAGCPAEVWITVMPDKRAGRYQAYLDGQQAPPCVSRQPFLDSARKLVWLWHDPLTILLMRWAGANDWALRGQLGAAAKLTVDEHNEVLAEWKPYSRSAVPPGSANTARTVANGRAAKKLIPESTAEKAGERAPMMHSRKSTLPLSVNMRRPLTATRPPISTLSKEAI